MNDKERWLWIDYARVANQQIERAMSSEYIADKITRARYFRARPTDEIRPHATQEGKQISQAMETTLSS